MDPDERKRYLKKIEEADQSGSVKKGGWLDRLIAQGNKGTEDQLAESKRIERRESEEGEGGRCFEDLGTTTNT